MMLRPLVIDEDDLLWSIPLKKALPVIKRWGHRSDDLQRLPWIVAPLREIDRRPNPAGVPSMKIRIGYELTYECPQPTPMIFTLSVHYTRVSDIIVPDHLIAVPPVPITAYRDTFGNWCSRIVAPQGQVRLSADALVNDAGRPDPIAAYARQTPVEQLPDETLLFLLGSRYCETDLLSEVAWQLF